MNSKMKHKKDRWYYKLVDGIQPVEGSDGIYYREPWIIVANFILKLLQPFSHKVWVVCAVSDVDDGDPHWTGYGFKRLDFIDGYFYRLKSHVISHKLMERYYKEEK